MPEKQSFSVNESSNFHRQSPQNDALLNAINETIKGMMDLEESIICEVCIG